MARGLQNFELYFHLVSIIAGLKFLQVNINKNLEKVPFVQKFDRLFYTAVEILFKFFDIRDFLKHINQSESIWSNVKNIYVLIQIFCQNSLFFICMCAAPIKLLL